MPHELAAEVLHSGRAASLRAPAAPLLARRRRVAPAVCGVIQHALRATLLGLRLRGRAVRVFVAAATRAVLCLERRRQARVGGLAVSHDLAQLLQKDVFLLPVGVSADRGRRCVDRLAQGWWVQALGGHHAPPPSAGRT